MHERAKALIAELGLEPHPEGGYYKQVFRSLTSVTRTSDAKERRALTAIYFLLAKGGSASARKSRWHCVTSDEIWTHVEGGVITLWRFDGDAAYATRLGSLQQDASPFLVVPANVWQAAELEDDYALIACFVAPGFEFDDFTLAADETASVRMLPRELRRLV